LELNNGETYLRYRSKFEAKQAAHLEKNDVDFQYEPDSFEYEDPVGNGVCKLCGSTEVVKGRTYTPDFFFPETHVYVETKGKFDAQSRRIIQNVCEHYPDMDLRMVFQRDNPLQKGAKMRYSRWCELRDIPYAIGLIPIDWTTDD